jgi:hypothetical protein
VAAAATPVFGADHGNPFEERFSIGLGTYFMASDTRVRADRFNSTEIGTTIDFENTFGFDHETVFRVEAAWRMFPRHKLRVMYFDSDRSAFEHTEFEIRFGNETFPADIDIRAHFEFEILELAYEYEILRHENFELGASLGIHNVGLELALGATLSTPGGGGTFEREEEISTDAPLPVLGLRGRWRMARDLYLQGHAQYFKLDFGDYDGDIQDYEIGLLWQFSKHVGVGAAYNLFLTEVDAADEGSFEGRLRWEYDGPQVFVRASF